MIAHTTRWLMAMLCERLYLRRMARTPEPAAVMDSSASVAAFHDQGGPDGFMVPVHRYNALATSRLAARGGTVLDLGSGTGQYLSYLARRRPDLTIVGVDLSERMVAQGRRSLEESGLSGRVRLEVGDMRSPDVGALGRVDLISCVYALHHLATFEDLHDCLGAIARLRRAFGSASWIFDFARPRNPRTIERFLSLFAPGAPEVFLLDARNSLRAAHSYDEVAAALRHVEPGPRPGRRSRGLGIHQYHYGPAEAGLNEGHGASWDEAPLPLRALREFRALCLTLPNPLVR